MKLRRRPPDLHLDMTPLIDVVFLLLTFFVFALVLMVRADVLDVALPELTSGRPARSEPAITVTLDQAGAVFLDGEPTDAADLPRLIEARREAHPAAPLLLAVDERAAAGDLLRITDTLVGAGLGEFSVIGRPGEPTSPPAPADAPTATPADAPANPDAPPSETPASATAPPPP